MPISAPPPSWASIKNKPNTVSGFGITDMASQSVASASQATKLANDSGSTPSYSCRAWVNFNGTGTVAIRSSGNVSSITDNGTGLYTVNFATALPDSNYVVNCGVGIGNGAGFWGFVGGLYGSGNTSASSVQVNNISKNNGSYSDNEMFTVSVFR